VKNDVALEFLAAVGNSSEATIRSTKFKKLKKKRKTNWEKENMPINKVENNKNYIRVSANKYI